MEEKQSPGLIMTGDPSSTHVADGEITEPLLANRVNISIDDGSDPCSHEDDAVVTPPRTDGNTPHLLGIPNELRNTIYEHLLAKIPQVLQDLHPHQKWLLTRPPCTINLGRTVNFQNVCRQLRNECIPMYLSRNNFIVDVSPKNRAQPAGYNRCIKTLTRLGMANVRCIKTLTIVNNDFGSSPSGFDAERPIPLIERWNKFVPALLSTGMDPSQLRWPGLYSDGLNGHSSSSWIKIDRRDIDHIVETAIWYLAVVEPTLRDFDCLCPQHSMANVLKQAFDGKLIHYCEKDWFRGEVAKGWKVVNNKRWSMKHGVAASPTPFEDLDRGPGKQSYILGQKNDPYRD